MIIEIFLPCISGSRLCILPIVKLYTMHSRAIQGKLRDCCNCFVHKTDQRRNHSPSNPFFFRFRRLAQPAPHLGRAFPRGRRNHFTCHRILRCVQVQIKRSDNRGNISHTHKHQVISSKATGRVHPKCKHPNCLERERERERGLVRRRRKLGCQLSMDPVSLSE